MWSRRVWTRDLWMILATHIIDLLEIVRRRQLKLIYKSVLIAVYDQVDSVHFPERYHPSRCNSAGHCHLPARCLAGNLIEWTLFDPCTSHCHSRTLNEEYLLWIICLAGFVLSRRACSKGCASGCMFLFAECRNKSQPGYYLQDQPTFSPEFKHILKSSVNDVD
jgi:hypothetical protein